MFYYMLSLKSMTNCAPFSLPSPYAHLMSISLSSIFSGSLLYMSFPPHVSQHCPLLDLDLRIAVFWVMVLQREDEDLWCYSQSRFTVGLCCGSIQYSNGEVQYSNLPKLIYSYSTRIKNTKSRVQESNTDMTVVTEKNDSI